MRSTHIVIPAQAGIQQTHAHRILVRQENRSGKPIHVLWGIHRENEMNTRRAKKLVHEGQYVAEVEVDLIETDEGWSPLFTLDDACKLDDVPDALRRSDLRRATLLAHVYTLTPVAP